MFSLRKTYPPVLYQLCFKRYTHQNYYDSLGVSAKSSQGDIKKAYYKLSMRYHPDKAEGNDIKFREITAAYEVLGNVKLRRLYDQGVINVSTRNPSADELSKASKHSPPPPDEQSRFYRSKAPSTGRTQFYNYDEWSKMHYQKTLNREIEFRKQRMSQADTRTYRRAESNSESVIRLFLILAIFASILGFVTSSRDIDRPSRGKTRITRRTDD
jgi:DnaJ-class molecular chaperone